MIYTDVMVDCETTGTDASRSAMIELSAVKFNLAERTVSNNTFSRCLKIPKWRSWDLGTREWWLKDKKAILDRILKAGEDPKIVMKDFFDWVAPAQGPLRFWAKPTTFDFNFVTSYLSDFDQPDHLFDFREATDMRSFLRGRYWPTPYDSKANEPTLEVGAHNSLVDVLHQIKVLFINMDKLDNAQSADNS